MLSRQTTDSRLGVVAARQHTTPTTTTTHLWLRPVQPGQTWAAIVLSELPWCGRTYRFKLCKQAKKEPLRS